MTLKPPRRTPVLPMALLRRDLPIVVCPGTAMGKCPLTSAFAPRPLRPGNDDGQDPPSGQARRNRRRHPVTSSFGCSWAASRYGGAVAGWRCGVTANAWQRRAAFAAERWDLLHVSGLNRTALP
jgi:hypothetical protein